MDNRKHAKYYPENLKQRAVKCLQSFASIKVASAIRISRSTLYLWNKEAKEQHIKMENINLASQDFIELPWSITPAQENSQLTIAICEKIKINVTGYSNADIAQLVSCLIQEVQ